MKQSKNSAWLYLAWNIFLISYRRNGNKYEDGVVKVHGSAMPQREPSRGERLDFTHTDGNARASAGDGVAIADARDGGRAVAASGEPGKIGSALERFGKH